tara:strand:- start:63 stop:668 length:606 start_codon:yes stop_codon:yes gene_type:complete
MYQIQSEYLFPTQVVTGQLPDFQNIQQPLVDWMYDYKEKNNDIARISNKGGWQSKSKEVFTDKGFKPFEKAIIGCVNELCMEFRLAQPLRLMQMWININGPNSYNVSHRHPGSILSGVLWVKQTAEMGRFVFDNMDNGYRDALLLTNTDVKHLLDHKMPPEYVPMYKDGTMIIFPSGLTHRVEINETTEDRLTLSFNICYG